MSFCRKLYEIVVAPALSIVKIQKTEDAPLDAPSISRLRAVSQQCANPGLVERLRRSLVAKVEPTTNQVAPPLLSSASSTNIGRPALALSSIASASTSTGEFARARSQGIVCGVNSVEAIVVEKEKESAVRRARVTSTRLTALKTYLEQGAN